MEDMTMEAFRGAVGDIFHISVEGGPKVEVELIQVKPLGPHERSSQQQSRQPFSIAFRGPLQPSLEQAIYRCENHRIGTLEQLFLVPFKEDGQGRYYEAIFN